MTITLGTIKRAHRRAELLQMPELVLRVPAEELWSMWIVGQPGFGKSTFLGNLAEAFADEGEGVLLIDTKGNLAEEFTARTKHTDRLIFLDPALAHTQQRYYSLNPLDFDRTDPLNFERYGNSLFETFVYIGEVAPDVMRTIQKVMTEAIALALARRGTTLTDVHLILHDEEHRERFLSAPGVPPQTLYYWRVVFPTTVREQRHVVDSTDSRIRSILKGPYLSYMLNQPRSSLQLVDWLDAGQIIVCNFDQRSLSPSTAKRLGNLFLGYLAGEIVKRPPGQIASRWRTIVDEAHTLATLPFAEMVTQMRTYNAFPIVASQSRKQMERNPELLAAADLTSAQFELMMAESDLSSLRWTRTPEQLTEARTRARYTARYKLTNPPKGVDFEGVLGLRPWHRDRVDGQFERLRAAGVERAIPKSQLRGLYDFDAFARLREKMMGDDNNPTNTTRPVVPRSGKGKAGPAGGHQGGGDHTGAAGSDPVSDQPADRPPVFHRPYPGRAKTGG